MTRFGPFALVFDKGELAVPGHLELLGLRGPGVPIVLDRIATALRADDAARWLAALLAEVNWRPHLVGALALLLEPRADAALLWGAIDRGSWVVPQLVVTAAHVDPQFRERIMARIADPAVRHAKLIASAVAMTAHVPDLADWRAGVLEDARIQALLAADAAGDRSDRLVASWLAAVRAAFLARGRTLVVL